MTMICSKKKLINNYASGVKATRDYKNMEEFV